MPGLAFHPEILEPRQAEVLAATAEELVGRGFRLGGGTGLALAMGHRQSIDFDWFTGEPMGDPMRLVRELADGGVALELESLDAGTVHATLSGVRVSLLEFRYPLVAEPITWPGQNVVVLSLDDIACMKLSAIAQRGARKDFVDLYALLRDHRPLAELLDLYREKFNVTEIGHLLYSLSYFEDAEKEPMPRMLWDVEWRDVRRAVESRVTELAG